MKLEDREVHPGVYQTLNKMGYMFSYLSEYGDSFVEYCSKDNSPVLDIATAFGTSALAALERGAVVYANDLDPRHLEFLHRHVPEKLKHNLKLCVGRFPQDLEFEKEIFSAILLSHVLHFLNKEEVQAAILKLYDWLKPGGRLFIITGTPFEKHIEKFIPIFEERAKTGDAYAGYVSDLSL